MFFDDYRNFHRKAVDFSILKGKYIDNIYVCADKREILIDCKDGLFSMSHEQDCCESVTLEDFKFEDLDGISGEVVDAYSTTNQENKKEDSEESFTWTFFTIQTKTRSITLRWYGTSNGYYGEEANLYELTRKE